MATPSKPPMIDGRYSTKMCGAANTKGPFPEAKILGYEFRNSYLLSEAFLQRTEPLLVDGIKYPDGNRRLALLGSTVLKTMMTQVWYETDEKKSQFHMWFQLISKNSFLSKIALVNGFDVVVVGLGGDLAERNGLPLWMTAQQKVLTEAERDKAVRIERAEFDRQMSDVVKALIGAVFNDSDGQVNRVLPFIWNLGIKKPDLAQDGVGIGHEVGRREQYLEGLIEELEQERDRVALEAAEKEIAEELAAEQARQEKTAAETRAAEEKAAQEQAAKAAEQKRKVEAQQRQRSQGVGAQREKKDLKRKMSQTDVAKPSPSYRAPQPPEPQYRRGPGPTMRF